MEHPHDDLRNDELGALFAEYKSLIGDPEPSANFMPQLWRRIESRQNVLLRVKRISQMFVAAAAAICILFATMAAVPNRQDVSSSYVDVLAQAYPTENLASHGILLDEADTK